MDVMRGKVQRGGADGEVLYIDTCYDNIGSGRADDCPGGRIGLLRDAPLDQNYRPGRFHALAGAQECGGQGWLTGWAERTNRKNLCQAGITPTRLESSRDSVKKISGKTAKEKGSQQALLTIMKKLYVLNPIRYRLRKLVTLVIPTCSTKCKDYTTPNHCTLIGEAVCLYEGRL